MKGSACSSWPTATGTDANGARSFAMDGTRIRANAGPTLNDKVARWGTPRASDGEKGGPNQSFGAGGMPLPSQAAQWPTPTSMQTREGWSAEELDSARQKAKAKAGNGNGFGLGLGAAVSAWPTPAARDWKGENSSDHLTNGTGRLHMDQLPNAVAHGFTRPDLPTQMHGAMPSPHAPISRPLWAWMTRSHGRTVSRRLWKARSKRRLNPAFVEWLMGWPPGHALCACSGMAWHHWQQDMRGALSQLPTASAPWIWKPAADAAPVTQQMDLFA